MTSDHNQNASASSMKNGSGRWGKWVMPVLVLLFAFVTLSGCSLSGCHSQPGSTLPGAEGRPKDAVSIFFSKYQGSQSIVEAVLRKLPPDNQGQPLRYALTELMKGPTPEEKGQGFYSEIPTGTKLLDVKTQGDTVTVDLSKPFTTGGGSTTMTGRLEQLKQTIFANDSSPNAIVTVEGKPLDTLGGEGLEVPGSLKRSAQ